MSTTPDPVPLAELERRLRAVVPSVRVVKERHLRKLVHRLAEDGEPVTMTPELPVWVGRDRARRYGVLPDEVTAGADESLLLVLAPDDLFPCRRPADEVLRHYWRLLFRGAVLADLRKQAEAGLLSAATVRDRFAALGPAVELEARFVLEADHLVPHEADGLTVYQTFVAVFADLCVFDPDSLKWVFPAAGAGVREVVSRDVAFDRLAAETRPDGAADPERAAVVDPHADPAAEAVVPEAELVPEGGPSRLLARADRAAGIGNHVRAAVLRATVARLVDGHNRLRARSSARAAVRHGLVKRLARVLGWDDRTSDRWAAALMPLLEPATRGVWPRAARCLYDLQKIPVDLEGEISTVDPIEWARTLGRRPLRRPITRTRGVILYHHLATARRHLHAVPMPAADRDRLDALLAGELHAVEGRVRDELGPVVRGVLDEVGLRPANRPEEVAREKLIAELLDRACERGFLRLGDLRDAVARNGLKMPDLAGPVEFVRGDPLLRADERLAEELDGVYRRGEIYLRWIHRGTAVAFGTAVGRWVSKYVAFPFGGAFLAVEFGKYLALEGTQLYHFVRRQFSDEHPVLDPSIPKADPDAGHGITLTPESAAVTVALGVLFLALLYWPAFRSAVWAGVTAVWSVVRVAAVVLPRALWRSPPVRWLRYNPLTLFFVRHFGTAFLVALVTAVVLIVLGADWQRVLQWAGLAFGGTAALLNTPGGRRFEDDLNEALADTWREVRVNLIPGVIGLIVWAFRELAGLVERGLYVVDEWFRFREGQGRSSLAVKAVLAAVWFPVEYLVRFGFNLLLEPQINPVKHFPVVTVSHKLLLPLIPAMAEALAISTGAATTVIACIPGIFGFIVWELKENWRLYAASRPDRLPRVVLGHHGETMRGLLRPGFHSGTVPALYRKLRAGVRRAALRGEPAAAGKLVEGLEHVAHAVELFVERELVPLLRSAAAWRGLTPRPGAVRVDVQSVEAEVEVPELGGPNLRLAFDHLDGAILARVAEAGWSERLSAEQGAVLAAALSGFCEMAASRLPEARPWTWPEWVAYWQTTSRPSK